MVVVPRVGAAWLATDPVAGVQADDTRHTEPADVVAAVRAVAGR